MKPLKEGRFRVLSRIMKVAQADSHETKLLLGVQGYLVQER
jgi:hypothetical protein